MSAIASKDGLEVRFADGPADVVACQQLRHQAFFDGKGLDVDPFDAKSRHLMVEQNGVLVCTLRLRVFEGGAPLTDTYTGQFYDLAALHGPAIEVGRFCMKPVAGQAAVLRIALGALARLVDETEAAFLFGCTSFAGVNPLAYADAFAYLAQHHQGPAQKVPAARNHAHIPLSRDTYDLTRSFRQMPKLLRSYLSMNGWVGDVAVIDPEMNTLHIFTVLEVGDVPSGRAKALRATL